jgi:hypothetical protein
VHLLYSSVAADKRSNSFNSHPDHSRILHLSDENLAAFAVKLVLKAALHKK